MSLYLAIFDGENEIEGWVLGHYSDFGYFRDVVARHFTLAQLPLLLGHSDCDGEWAVIDLPNLRAELESVAKTLRRLPPEHPLGAFEHAAPYRVAPSSLYDCFHNVDGENLIEALLDLASQAETLGLPILFQ